MAANSVLMTEGPIHKKIIQFAVPIFWGSLFQQLYNVMDSIIVGNFIGKDALAAISATSALIGLLTGFFMGVFSGAGVVIARYFGAGDKEKIENAVHTSVAVGIISGIMVTFIGYFAAPLILSAMGTPASVFPNAEIYVKIYFGGIITVVMYNTASGIFQSVGDSKRPLYFLLISSAINVVLDLLFVVVFKFGIAGAAYATVISQGISVILCFVYLTKTKDVNRVTLSKIKIHKDLLGQIIKYGVPSGIQNSVICLANVVVQSKINVFDSYAVAGCGAYSKIEGFAFLPVTSFAMSMAPFISQNIGAGEYERARKGSVFGIIACSGLAELVGIIFFIVAPYAISMFNQDPVVINYGTEYARTTSLFFCVLAFSHCMAGIMRGAGKAVVPMTVMLLCWCVIRVSYLTIATKLFPVINTVYWAYPITWTLSSIIFLIYYLKSDWLREYSH